MLRGYAIINKFQSTHPRGVRPDRLRILFRMYIVSIHAPAWGATKSSFGCRGSSAVSIHAPSWGATRSGREQYRDRSRFNPRTRVGCDAHIAERIGEHVGFNPRTRVGCDITGSQFQIAAQVSIHAPAWGATPRVLPMMGGQEFQSTHPRGVRRSDAGELARHRSRFNPRTRVGCDVAYQVACDGYNMFQSTHPRGVRPDSEPAGSTGGSVSIHAPAWGATNCRCP